MPVGLQDPGPDGPLRPRRADQDREDPPAPGAEPGPAPVHRRDLQGDLHPAGRKAHAGVRSVTVPKVQITVISDGP